MAADVIRFSLPHGIDARGVAAELVDALGGTLADAIRGDRDEASFSYRWSSDQAPERIEIQRFAPPNSIKTAYRDRDPRSIWLLRSTQYRHFEAFTQRLTAMGAGDVRAFTEEEWENR